MVDHRNREALLRAVTARVVEAQASNDAIATDQIPNLISDTYEAFAQLGVSELPEGGRRADTSNRDYAINDHVVCLECGRKFKSLKRHLATAYNFTPEQYRQRWKLPADYPLNARSKSSHRQPVPIEDASDRPPSKRISKRKMAGLTDDF